MAEIIYRIVAHDGGFAYKVGDVFSETFASREAAHAAAVRAAQEQRIPDVTTTIEFEDAEGHWQSETDRGDDRPSTKVVDED